MFTNTDARLRWAEALGIAAIVLGAIVGIISLQQSRLQSSASFESASQAVQQEKIRLRLLQQTPSFGFDNILADWTFLNFLQYYGDEAARKKTGYSLSPDYFDVITRRDPRFTGVYLFLSGSVSHQLGKPELAIDLMKRGTRALSPQFDPLAFQVWQLMSLDQLLLLGDIPGSIHSLEMAADWVKATPYARYANRFRETANFLRQDPNSKPVRVAAWGDIYQQAVAIGDKQTQARAKREILALGGKILEKDGELYIQPPPLEPKGKKQQKVKRGNPNLQASSYELQKTYSSF